jgi:hypothetical protein
MSKKMYSLFIALLLALAIAGTVYAKSKKPVLVVVCPVQTTVIDYTINPDKVTLIAYEKCLIYKGAKAAKTGTQIDPPPGDPPIIDPPVNPPPPPEPPIDPPPPPEKPKTPPACTKSNGKAPIKNPHCNGGK